MEDPIKKNSDEEVIKRYSNKEEEDPTNWYKPLPSIQIELGGKEKPVAKISQSTSIAIGRQTKRMTKSSSSPVKVNGIKVSKGYMTIRLKVSDFEKDGEKVNAWDFYQNNRAEAENKIQEALYKNFAGMGISDIKYERGSLIVVVVFAIAVIGTALTGDPNAGLGIAAAFASLYNFTIEEINKSDSSDFMANFRKEADDFSNCLGKFFKKLNDLLFGRDGDSDPDGAGALA